MHKLEIKSVKAITNCFNVSTKATVYAHTYYKKLVKVYKSQKDTLIMKRRFHGKLKIS